MQEGNRIIRKASLPRDTEGIMAVFSAAKAIMVASGNANQWKEGYPSLDIVQSDIEKNGGYVIEERLRVGATAGMNNRIVAYFAFLPSPEPTYSKIYDGKWLEDTLPYHVIHRIASYPDVHGIFESIIEFCAEQEPNLRIDTHKDNRIMLHVIEKHGFTYCGIIHLASGDERLRVGEQRSGMRLAYQRLNHNQESL